MCPARVFGHSFPPRIGMAALERDSQCGPQGLNCGCGPEELGVGLSQRSSCWLSSRLPSLGPQRPRVDSEHVTAATGHAQPDLPARWVVPFRPRPCRREPACWVAAHKPASQGPQLPTVSRNCRCRTTRRARRVWTAPDLWWRCVRPSPQARCSVVTTQGRKGLHFSVTPHHPARS